MVFPPLKPSFAYPNSPLKLYIKNVTQITRAPHAVKKFTYNKVLPKQIVNTTKQFQPCQLGQNHIKKKKKTPVFQEVN